MVPNINDLATLLYLRADKQPEQLYARFLVDGRVTGAIEERSYSALTSRAENIAANLQPQGLDSEPVLMIYPPGLTFIDALFGCVLAGIVGVPVYAPNPARLADSLEQIKSIALDCGAQSILSTSTIIERFAGEAKQVPGLADLTWIDTTALDSDAVPLLQANRPAPSDPVYLQYTSGSTGQRKGVIITHENLMENARMIAAGFANGPALNGVSWLPVQHDMGLVGGVLQPFAVGGRITLMSPFDFLRFPARWLEAISTFGADVSGGPDFCYAHATRMVKESALEGLDLSSWRLAFTGAEPVRPETMDAFTTRFAPIGFQAKAFYPCYGMAESTLIVSGGQAGNGARLVAADNEALATGQLSLPSDGQPSRLLVGCGQPLLASEIVVVDPKHHTALASGCVGEIWIRGKTVSPGYWQSPQATAETFQAFLPDGRGPFLRTGDIGLLDEAGELYVTGRIKDLIIVRGRNIYPQDLEATVELTHSAICSGEVAAFSVEGENEEEIVIVAALKKRAQVEPTAVMAAIRRHLGAEHQVMPAQIALIRRGQIPKTGSGKLQRSKCRQLYQEQALTPWQ